LIREETQADLNLTDAKDGQVMVICNRGAGGWITGNLLGPLVINTVSRLAVQVVLTEKKWTCRQPLLRLPQGEATSAGIMPVATVTPMPTPTRAAA
jgi:flagellar assembly factor FliW